METIETKRFLLRPFRLEDWPDVQELTIDWNKSPAPDFDKWPSGEADVKSMTEFLAGDRRFFAVALRETGKVVGLLAQNGFDENQEFDLGHVILSRYQDNDHDREVLEAMVDHIFAMQDVRTIVTKNAPGHAEQLAPLMAMGFKAANPAEPGILSKPRPGG
jgi:RimJ/RimL family protein N-acetyltransferase